MGNIRKRGKHWTAQVRVSGWQSFTKTFDIKSSAQEWIKHTEHALKSNVSPDYNVQSMPRQRVFYIGYRYVGPMLCQDVQSLYLKRKGVKHGERWWAVITYGKYYESDSREYSRELEECLENDVPDMLDMFDDGNEVTFSELEDMGWRGQVMYSADIVLLKREQ